MSLNNTVIFVFLTILNVMLFIALSMFARLMWTEEEKGMSVLMACLAITSLSFIEYMLIGGLIK